MTRPPPHRSRRAVVPHRAPQESSRPQGSLGTPSGQSRRRTPDEVRTLHPEVGPQVPKPSPRRAPPLAAAIEPCAQESRHPGEERLPAGRAPVDALVVEEPRPLAFNSRHRSFSLSRPCSLPPSVTRLSEFRRFWRDVRRLRGACPPALAPSATQRPARRRWYGRTPAAG